MGAIAMPFLDWIAERDMERRFERKQMERDFNEPDELSQMNPAARARFDEMKCHALAARIAASDEFMQSGNDDPKPAAPDARKPKVQQKTTAQSRTPTRGRDSRER